MSKLETSNNETPNQTALKREGNLTDKRSSEHFTRDTSEHSRYSFKLQFLFENNAHQRTVFCNENEDKNLEENYIWNRCVARMNCKVDISFEER